MWNSTDKSIDWKRTATFQGQLQQIGNSIIIVIVYVVDLHVRVYSREGREGASLPPPPPVSFPCH